MTDLPQATGVSELTPALAHEVVKGLTPLARYSSDFLYRRYTSLARQRGVEPVSQNALGRMLRHIGCDRRRFRPPNSSKITNGWLVTYTSQREEWADGRWP